MDRLVQAITAYCQLDRKILPKWSDYESLLDKEPYVCEPLKLKEEELSQKCGVCTPKARSGHRLIATDTAFYSFGGYNPDIPSTDLDMNEDPYWSESDPLFRELWEFHFATRTWRKVACSSSCPTALASHSVVQCGPRSLIVYGGTGMPFGFNSSNDLYHCNLASGEWNKVVTRGTVPTPQYGQAAVIRPPYLYVIGGTTGFEYSLDVHRLNLNELTWDALTYDQHLGARYRHEVASLDSDIFVFGGGTNESEFGLDVLPVFNVDSRKWRGVVTQGDDGPTAARSSFPAPRRCHALAQIGEDVIILGGTDGRRGFSDFWRINLKELVWRRLSVELPHPLYFHSAAVTSAGKLWIFGGVKSVEEISRSKSVFSVWLVVPSLQEMAWEALLHYAPFLAQMKPENLSQIGIPDHLIRRCDRNRKPSANCYCAIYRHIPAAYSFRGHPA